MSEDFKENAVNNEEKPVKVNHTTEVYNKTKNYIRDHRTATINLQKGKEETLLSATSATNTGTPIFSDIPLPNNGATSSIGTLKYNVFANPTGENTLYIDIKGDPGFKKIESKELVAGLHHALDEVLKGKFTPEEAHKLDAAAKLMVGAAKDGKFTETETQSILKALNAAETEGKRGR